MTDKYITYADFIASRTFGEIYDLSQCDDEETGWRYLDTFYITCQVEKDPIDPEITYKNAVVTVGNQSCDFGEDLAAAERWLWEEFAWGELNWKHVDFDSEFGTDYQLDQKQVMRLMEEGFVDTSWHNDMCPSFTLNIDGEICENGHEVRFWFDAPDAKNREMGEDSFQFAVVLHDVESYDHQPLIETDNFDAALVMALGLRALPTDEVEWGSENQVERENHFWDVFEKIVKEGDGDFGAFEEYALKATTEEAVMFCLQSIYESYHEGACLPQSVFNTKFDTGRIVIAPTRKFNCSWTNGYDPHGEVVDGNWFKDDRGYDDEHLEKIRDLEVGETADLSDLSGTHVVVRLA